MGEFVEDAHSRKVLENMVQDLQLKTRKLERLSQVEAKVELRSQAEMKSW